MFRKLPLAIAILLPFFCISQELDLLILNQDYEAALSIIDKKLEINQNPDLYFKKGIIHKEMVDYPSSIQAISQAIELDTANIDYLSARAALYQSLGINSKAVLDIEKAILISPENLKLKYELGKLYIRQKEHNKAYDTFEEIQAVDSLNVMYNRYSALAAYKAKRMKRAANLYQKYLSQNPDDLSAYFYLYEALGKSGKKDEAKIVLYGINRRFPNNKAITLKIANASFVDKNFQMGQRFYHQYLSRYDTTTPILLNYGICLYHNKMYEDAVSVLDECFFKAPNDTYINFYLGVCHKKLKNHEKAIEFLDFAIYASVPEFHPEMYHHLAQAYGAQREFKKSIECYKKAYELDSRKVEVLFEIATTYEEFTYKSSEALAYYRSYLKEAGEEGENIDYALDRVKIIKEELFMNE